MQYMNIKQLETIPQPRVWLKFLTTGVTHTQYLGMRGRLAKKKKIQIYI